MFDDFRLQRSKASGALLQFHARLFRALLSRENLSCETPIVIIVAASSPVFQEDQGDLGLMITGANDRIQETGCTWSRESYRETACRKEELDEVHCRLSTLESSLCEQRVR